MTSKEINRSIETMKIHLTKSDKTEHWLNFIVLLIPICLIGYESIEKVTQNKEFSFFVLLILGFFTLFLRHKLISQKLDVYKSNLTEEQFKQANQAAARINGWTILSNSKNYFSAIKNTNWQWDGIKISAILKNGKLYLNSMVNPSTRSNPFTLGLNKKNKTELISQYQSILKGNDVNVIAINEIAKREKKIWSESEWTFKNIIKRIIGYGLSILFIVLAIWMILSYEIKGLIYGIILIGFCGTYIYYDVKVILEKKKAKL